MRNLLFNRLVMSFEHQGPPCGISLKLRKTCLPVFLRQIRRRSHLQQIFIIIARQGTKKNTSVFLRNTLPARCMGREGFLGYSPVSFFCSFSFGFFFGLVSGSTATVISSFTFKGERFHRRTCGDKGCCSLPSPSSLHKQHNLDS